MNHYRPIREGYKLVAILPNGFRYIQDGTNVEELQRIAVNLEATRFTICERYSNDIAYHQHIGF